MTRSLEEGQAPAHAEMIRQRIPLGRYAEPDDIARVMLFLAGSDSEFLTGGVYMAGGGWSTR